MTETKQTSTTKTDRRPDCVTAVSYTHLDVYKRQEHIRHAHNAYCRIVIRHASFDAARMLAARWKWEISLEYLTEEKFVPLSTIDEYFQVPDYGETYPFSVRGQTIFLDMVIAAVAKVLCKHGL